MGGKLFLLRSSYRPRWFHRFCSPPKGGGCTIGNRLEEDCKISLEKERERERERKRERERERERDLVSGLYHVISCVGEAVCLCDVLH